MIGGGLVLIFAFVAAIEKKIASDKKKAIEQVQAEADAKQAENDIPNDDDFKQV